jgi:hypothetical protein
MQSDIFRRLRTVPPIVHVVLTQAARRRARGNITDAIYEEQIRRLAREELEPKGLKLLERQIAGGRTRFIIKEQATGIVCDLLNLDAQGMLEADSSHLVEGSRE